MIALNLSQLTRRVVWLNKEAPSNGSSYSFRDISMHAVAPASESFDKACLYCHLDTEDVTELRFVPEDSTSCLYYLGSVNIKSKQSSAEHL